MVERSKRPSGSRYKKVFTYGLLLVLIGEVAGLIIYYLSSSGPGGFITLLYFGAILFTAVQLGNRLEMKGSFIYAGILALIGGCSAGGTLKDYRDYMRVPHRENVELTDMIENPANYDNISLFYFQEALVREDMIGTNTMEPDPQTGQPKQTFKVAPLIARSQQEDSIKKVGAWIVADQPGLIPADKNMSGLGLSRIVFDFEPYYRGAVRKVEEKYGVESDWNAPILVKAGDRFTRPRQFFWVIFLVTLWPGLWVITRFNLLLKK